MSSRKGVTLVLGGPPTPPMLATINNTPLRGASGIQSIRAKRLNTGVLSPPSPPLIAAVRPFVSASILATPGMSFYDKIPNAVACSPWITPFVTKTLFVFPARAIVATLFLADLSLTISAELVGARLATSPLAVVGARTVFICFAFAASA